MHRRHSLLIYLCTTLMHWALLTLYYSSAHSWAFVRSRLCLITLTRSSYTMSLLNNCMHSSWAVYQPIYEYHFIYSICSRHEITSTIICFSAMLLNWVSATCSITFSWTIYKSTWKVRSYTKPYWSGLVWRGNSSTKLVLQCSIASARMSLPANMTRRDML